MSPTTVVRPVWVWSLPAVAVIISFLWYRKKRGAAQPDPGVKDKKLSESVKAKTDSLWNAETQGTCAATNSELCEKEEEVSVKAEADSPVRRTKGAVEAEEVAALLRIKEEVQASEEVASLQRIEEVVQNKEVKDDFEERCTKEEPTLKVEPDSPSRVEDPAEEVEDAVSTIADEEVCVKEEVSSSTEVPEELTTATPVKEKAREPKKEEGSKWAKDKMEDGIEEQLTKLKIGETSEAGASPKTERASGERDSANTSPSEVMLASPSLSGYSDTHSEGSSDSGKGCSDVLTPSPTPVSGNSLSGDHPSDIPAICLYEFVIPQHLVGRLIGRNGSHINDIKESTHASVYIKRHPETTKLKICAVEGTQVDIDNALDMIRHKFPKKRYPNVTLEPVEIPPELPPVLPEYMQLYLVDGVNNDVIISSLVSAGHMFLQQPTHPTFPSLNRLNTLMNAVYAEPNLPGLPDDLQPEILCVAPVNDSWYRASVTSVDGANCDVKFVDYGGFMTLDKTQLKLIRTDFVTLPFQASECLLLGVEPTGDGWCPEARELVETLTFGKMLSAQIHGYTDTAIPLIYLYTVLDNQVVSVNEQLVEHGFAQWLLPPPVTEPGEPTGYVTETADGYEFVPAEGQLIAA